MQEQHQWVTFSKGRMHVTGCARCGQVLLPTNENAKCRKVPSEDNLLLKRGFQITRIHRGTQVA